MVQSSYRIEVYVSLNFSLSDVPNTKTVLEHICLLENRPAEEWKGSTKLKKQFSDSEFPWTEFTLDELGLPDAEYLLSGIKNLEYQIGIRGWKQNGNVSERYQGISLTYNPIIKDNPFYQTLGSDKLTQQVSAGINHGNHNHIKNTYYDSYGFNSIKRQVYLSLQRMWDRFTMMPVRSRVSYANYHNIPDYLYGNEKRGWHTDEPSRDVLRLNIPLQTQPEYGIEFKDGTFKVLEVGKVYIWDTSIVHRVAVSERPKNNDWRINLVIGLSPGWVCNKDRDAYKYSTTEYHGISIQEVIQHKLFVKNN